MTYTSMIHVCECAYVWKDLASAQSFLHRSVRRTSQVDYHTGFAMHSYHRDAPGISDEEYAKYKYPVPRELVEPREEGSSRDPLNPVDGEGCSGMWGHGQGWGRHGRLRNRIDDRCEIVKHHLQVKFCSAWKGFWKGRSSVNAVLQFQ